MAYNLSNMTVAELNDYYDEVQDSILDCDPSNPELLEGYHDILGLIEDEINYREGYEEWHDDDGGLDLYDDSVSEAQEWYDFDPDC